MRSYDPNLYLKWNPKKNSGQGTWELHERSKKKTAVFKGKHKNMSFYQLEYLDKPLLSHIMDVPRLSYELMYEIQARDVWAFLEKEKTSINRTVDYYTNKRIEKQHKETEEEVRYAIKQDKKLFKELLEHVRSGHSLNPILRKMMQ